MSLYDKILYVLLIILSIAVIAALIAGAMAIKRENPFTWPVILALVVIGSLLTRPIEYQPGPLDRAIAQRTLQEPKPRSLRQILDEDCPAPGPGLTPEVIVTIESRSDIQPRITGCSRVAEQRYILNAQKGN